MITVDGDVVGVVTGGGVPHRRDLLIAVGGAGATVKLVSHLSTL
jgi:hypothetical protein